MSDEIEKLKWGIRHDFSSPARMIIDHNEQIQAAYDPGRAEAKTEIEKLLLQVEEHYNDGDHFKEMEVAGACVETVRQGEVVTP